MRFADILSLYFIFQTVGDFGEEFRRWTVARKEKRRKGTGKITLTEVAEFVGVSAMTVSASAENAEAES